jgi:hypothetical protein
MISRRRFLKKLSALPLAGIPLPFLTGCIMKSNIETKKEYKYLVDWKVRFKEWGEHKKLIISDAEFTNGDPFRGESWDTMIFQNCVFKTRCLLGQLHSVIFENCVFDNAEFQADKMHFIRFRKCKFINNATVLNSVKSEDVIFENSEFYGTDGKDDNNWGGVDFAGDVTFRNCRAKWAGLVGEDKVVYEGCQFEDVNLMCGEYADNKYADITVKQCVFKGRVDLSSTVTNLAISDTQFDQMLMQNMYIKNLSVENSKGGQIDFYGDELDSIVLRNLELNGFHDKNMAFADSKLSLRCFVRKQYKTLVMENVRCFPDATPQQPSGQVGSPITCGSESASVKNCVLPIASFLLNNSKDVEFEGLQSDTLHFLGNVDKLNFTSGCEVQKELIFYGTQAKEVNLSGMTTAKGSVFDMLGTNFKELEKEGKFKTGREGQRKK